MKTTAKRRFKKQEMLPDFLPKPKDTFIAAKRGTHAKTVRPLDSKKPLHICFRSQFARGKRSMLGLNKVKVNGLVGEISKRFGLKIQRYANVGNHLHLVVQLPGSAMTARRQYIKWIRLLTSRLAFEVGGSKKGQPFTDERGEKAKFWDAIPFSRVIHGDRGWRIIDRYVLKNNLESQGVPKLKAIAMAREIYDSGRALDLPSWRSSA